jgi:hypothetical protein
MVEQRLLKQIVSRPLKVMVLNEKRYQSLFSLRDKGLICFFHTLDNGDDEICHAGATTDGVALYRTGSLS